MGMRQNIRMSYSDGHQIYIYSHWGGNEPMKESGLAKDLAKALNRKERWNDESYLARIIMSEVIRDSLDDETGFGLAPYETDPEFPTISVNFEARTVQYGNAKPITYEAFIEEMGV